jgi:hypothetical protein
LKQYLKNEFTKKSITIAVLVSFVFMDFSWAISTGTKELYVSPTGLGMGGAGVALVENEEAIFRNPSGLAGYQGVGFYADAKNEMTGDIYDTGKDAVSAFSSDFDISNFNLLVGKNIYGRSQVTPSVVIPNFGFAGILDGQMASYAKNKAFTNFLFGYMLTTGFQASAGWNVMGGRMTHRRPQLRVGLGAKYLWRRGGYRNLSAIDALNMSDASYRSNLIGPYRSGVGLDVGAQYVHPVNRRWRLFAGTAFTEVGDIYFGDSNEYVQYGPETNQGSPDPQKGNFSIGIGSEYIANSWFTVRSAYDYAHILDPIDWRQKNHLGVELKFPIISLLGGINQIYPTYGAAFDLWMFRCVAVSYGHELGNFVNNDPVRRYLLSLTLALTL